MQKLWVSAAIRLTPGSCPTETAADLAKLAEKTRAEPGCLQFDILQDRTDPSRFLLWECWVDDTALSTHFEQPHTKAFLATQRTEVAYIEELNRVTVVGATA